MTHCIEELNEIRLTQAREIVPRVGSPKLSREQNCLCCRQQSRDLYSSGSTTARDESWAALEALNNEQQGKGYHGLQQSVNRASETRASISSTTGLGTSLPPKSHHDCSARGKLSVQMAC